MPIYSIRNKKTKKEWEEYCTWDELQSHLSAHPNWETFIAQAPLFLGDNMRSVSGLKHTPEFRETLQRVKEHHPKSTIDVGNKTDI